MSSAPGTRVSAGAKWSGLGFATASGLCFSVSTVVGQLLLDEGASSTTIAGIRLAAGATVLWCCALLLRSRRVGWRRAVLLLATGTLTAAQVPLLFEAVDRVGSSTAILLLFAYPSIVAMLSVATRRERMTRHKAVGIALSLAGTLLVIGASDARISLLGCLFGLGSATALALYITAADRTTEGVDAFTATAWIQLGAFIAIAPLVALRASGAGLGSLPWWSPAVGLASAAAALLFIRAMARVTPTIASISSTVEPISTAVLAFLVLGDVLTGRQLAGGLLIVSAVLVVSRAPRADAVATTSGGRPRDRVGQ